jgi:hypothetical protein
VWQEFGDAFPIFSETFTNLFPETFINFYIKWKAVTFFYNHPGSGGLLVVVNKHQVRAASAWIPGFAGFFFRGLPGCCGGFWLIGGALL